MSKQKPTPESILAHAGVKGMKWGVRKDRGTSQTSNTSKRPPAGEVVLDTKLDSGGTLVVRTDPPGRLAQALAKKFKSVRNVQESVHNFTLTNERGEKVGEASFIKSSSDTLALEWIGVRKAHRNKGYASAAMRGVIEYAKNNDITTLNLTATDMGAGIYESLGFKKTGDDGVYSGTYSMTIPEKIKHSADENLLDPEVFAQYLKGALNKYVRKSSETEDFLEHFGVKGMKWGVRKEDSNRRVGKSEVSRRTQRDAGRDAKEFAKAKMYYGEGAGVRRRLINNTVKSKSKDPSYKSAFDKALSNQDMSKAASQARSKRKRTDISNSARKTVRGVGHTLRGNSQYASLAAVTLVGVGAYGYNNRAKISSTLKPIAKSMSQKAKNVRNQKSMRTAKTWMKEAGF